MKHYKCKVFTLTFIIILTTVYIICRREFLPWRTLILEDGATAEHIREMKLNLHTENTTQMEILESKYLELAENMKTMMQNLKLMKISNSSSHEDNVKDSKSTLVGHASSTDILAKKELLKEFDGWTIQIVSNPNFCSHTDIEVVIMVISRPTSLFKRIGIRTTYGDPRLFPTIRVFFVIGPDKDNDMTEQISREHSLYGDIVLTDRPHDLYRNTSFKVLAGLHYIDKYCESASFVVKTDEDVIINSFNLLGYLKGRQKIVNNGYFNSPDDYQANGRIFCNQNYGTPIRDPDSPWFVPVEDFGEEMYPNSCSGMGVMFDRNIISTLYSGSFFVNHLNIEDIFFWGLVRTAYTIPIEFVDEHFGGLFSEEPSIEKGIYFHGMSHHTMFHEKWNDVMIYEAERTLRDGNRSIPLTIKRATFNDSKWL